MNRICAHCGKVLGFDPRLTGISHGICKDCLKAQFRELREEQSEQSKNIKQKNQ